MALSRVVDAGQDSINDLTPKRASDSEIGLALSRNELSVRGGAAFQRAHDGCPYRDHTATATVAIPDRVDRRLRDIESLRKWKAFVQVFIAGSTKPRSVRQRRDSNAALLQFEQYLPTQGLTRRRHF